MTAGGGNVLSQVASTVMRPVVATMRTLGDAIPIVRAATVLSDFSPTGETIVAFDTAPTVPAAARSVAGLLARGTRVICLLYPPHGVLVLGAMSTRGTAGLTLDRLRLRATNDVSLTSLLHAFQIGLSSGANLRIDINEIQAVANGIKALLALNAQGGDVSLFDQDAAGGNILDVQGFINASQDITTADDLNVGDNANIAMVMTCGNMAAGQSATPAPGVAGGVSSVAVVISPALTGTPRVFLTPNITAASVANVRSIGYQTAAATGFTVHVDRADNNGTNFSWLAVAGMG